MPIVLVMDKTIENVGVLLNKLREKLDKQEAMLKEILKILKTPAENSPSPQKLGTVTTRPLDNMFTCSEDG